MSSSLPSPGQGKRPGAGFTQTDLAVTIAVLSILAAIVIPLMLRSQAKTKLELCKSNLRQVARAILLYAEDQGGTLPNLVPSPAPGAWWHYKSQVERYAPKTAGRADKIFACPGDRGYGEGTESALPFHASKKYNHTSYVFNGVNLPGVPNIAGWPVSRVKTPARTLLVMEWTAHAPLSWHKSRTGKANAPFYDGAQSVVAFVDGRVDFIPIYYDGINAAYTRDPIEGFSYRYSGE